MHKTFFLPLLIVLTFIGCSQPRSVQVFKQSKPSWILNPYENGKIGAIGVASRTHDQKISTQRKLAITRALEELSLQQGVKVILNIDKKEKVKNNITNTSLNVDSNFKSSNSITAHIEAVWKNNYTSELYIWMVLD